MKWLNDTASPCKHPVQPVAWVRTGCPFAAIDRENAGREFRRSESGLFAGSTPFRHTRVELMATRRQHCMYAGAAGQPVTELFLKVKSFGSDRCRLTTER